MNTDIVTDIDQFFSEMVSAALDQRGLKTYPLVSNYLADLLQQYTVAERLTQDTLAEMYLKAVAEESNRLRIDSLKTLGDTSLYISGFFGDSLKHKVVDIDYYANIGGRAYEHLATEVEEDTYAKIYGEISQRFLDFVDVLTIISQKAMIQTNKDLLRLYDRYVSTGSALAKEQLLEKGLLPTEEMQKKKRQ